MQKKTKRNFKTVALSLLLVAAMVVTGISAYFTATDTATNVFTVGSIKIDLQEPSWDENSAYPTTPNETVEKDPQIENIGMSDAYVYLTVEVPYANVEVADADGNVSAAADTELFSYTVNSGWVEVGTPVKDEAKGVYKHVYAYAADADTLTVLEPDTITATTLFDEVKFANVVETPDDDGSLKDLLEGADLNIVINAYGIETEIVGGNTTPNHVWSVIVNDLNTKPVLLEGDGSTYSLFAVNDLRFRSSAPMDEFQEVQVNGVTVDPQYYTVSEGSTVIHLSGEYLATLNADEHDIAIVSDAGAAESTFSATEGIPAGCTYTVKATGEVLTEGDELPDAPAQGDVYMTSDYEFHYLEGLNADNIWEELTEEVVKEMNGMGYGKFSNWFFAVKDQTKESYNSVPTMLFGEPITNFTSVFAHCSNLKYAPDIPSVASAMTATFYGCTSLLEVPCIPSSAVTHRTFEGCTALTDITIPEGMTTVNENLFKECTSLVSVKLPDSVTSIGKQAFSGCTGLTSVDFGNGITSIGDSAFRDCTGLISMPIPDSVTNIGGSAFSGCTGLEQVTLGNGITETANYLFEGCTSLSSVSMPSITTIGSYTFQGCTGLTTIAIPNSVTSVGENIFENCANLTSVVLSNNMTSVPYKMFYNCTNLGSIEIPKNVTSIDTWAFSYCENLTSIYIPESVTSIGAVSDTSSPFYKCSPTLKIYCGASEAQSSWGTYWNYYDSGKTLGVKYNTSRSLYDTGHLIIENGTTVIEDNEYSGYEIIKSVTLPDSVTSIGDYSFAGCTNLSSITIPKSVTSIESFAFFGCSNLKTINYEGTEAEWNAISKLSGWKSDCPTDMVISYKKLTEPNYNVAGSYDFDGNLLQTWDSLTVNIETNKNPWDSDLLKASLSSNAVSLVIKEGATAIGNYQLYGCNNLMYIFIPEGVTSIGTNSLVCSNLTSVVIPSSVTSIGANAFNGCQNLKTINFTGTEEEWNAITFGSNWNLYCPSDMVINYNYVAE